MNLGATIIGQMITFAIFVWFTMRFIWPLLEAVLGQRKKKIADGLAAAEKGHLTLAKAREDIENELKLATVHREEILAQANKQAQKIIEDAKQAAQRERDDIIKSGQIQVQHELHSAQSKLQSELANIIVLGAEKILGRSIKDEDHQQLLDQVVKKIATQSQ